MKSLSYFKHTLRSWPLYIALLSFTCSCYPKLEETIVPTVVLVPQQSLIDCLPSAFPPLTYEESSQEWAKEFKIGRGFAQEFDLYRAITAYKRALFLLPDSVFERRQQLQFHLMQCYYFGQKYQEVLDVFDSSDLKTLTTRFPAFGDLLLMLYDSYNKTCREEKAEKILKLIEKFNEEGAEKLKLSEAVLEADFSALYECAPCNDRLGAFLLDYQLEAKSIRKAARLNAVLPGAGYLYVGQKKTALTSLILNTLFIATTYQLFHKGYIGAGLFTLSLETGWYFGGIHGAGLAAKEHNERIYSQKAKDYLLENKGFPLLMIETSF